MFEAMLVVAVLVLSLYFDVTLTSYTKYCSETLEEIVR